MPGSDYVPLLKDENYIEFDDEIEPFEAIVPNERRYTSCMRKLGSITKAPTRVTGKALATA